MGRRMRETLALYHSLTEQTLTREQAGTEKEKLLIQIGFLQHERLIHLLVTILFAILTVATLYVNLFLLQPVLFILALLLLVLLVPYIMHYYLLENGVQKLYGYYDKLQAMSEITGEK